jgi:vitamin B12 transporter
MSTFNSSRRGVCGAFVAGALGAAGLAAAQEPSQDGPAVLVTASRTSESVNDTLWSSTVITRADIEARQPSSMLELLSDVPGINIANNGGLGKLSSVFIRGAESNHTLLLVDGVRVAVATAGMAPFELIPVSQIERIEIVRGPRSTLYGSDAMGGVIQVFTRRATRHGLAGSVSVGGGSHDERKGGATLQGRGERGWFSFGAESFDTDGFNSCVGNFGAGCFAVEPDRDGHRSNSGSLAAGYSLNDAWQAELRSLVSDGRSEFDGSLFSGNETEFSERVVALSLDGALAGGWHTRVTLGRNEDHRDNFFREVAGTTFVSVFDSDRDQASVQLDGPLGEALRLVSGVEYQRDEVAGSTDYAVGSRNTKSAFGELHVKFGEWSGLAGARYEDDDQFGSHVTGNAGIGRALTDRLRFTATWGTAFHAPTFDDLYYPFYNNPNLEPEESRSIEVGVSGRAAQLPVEWSLHVFQTDIDQLIGFEAFGPVNIDEARIRGAELQGKWRGELWTIGGHVSRLDPVNRSAFGGPALLPRRSKENASLELQRFWPSFAIGAVARYQGARFDDVANSRPLGGFVTADLMATQSIGEAFELQARVANVFDRDYQTAAFYLQDGVNYNVSLRYRFAAGR